MDTLVTVQKLLRLRALIHDPPLSSGDVFVKPTKEPHSVGHPPVVEVNPQDSGVRTSRSWTSSADSVHSASQESPPRATIPIPKVFYRTLSKYTSRSTRMLGPTWKLDSEHQVDDVDPPTRRWEVRASMMSGLSGISGMGSSHSKRSDTLWTDSDSFLPRAKPPHPLKRTKHTRNHSDSVPPDLLLPSSPPPSHCGSSGQLSRSDSRASLLPRRSFDVQALEISRERGKKPAGPRPLRRRASTRTAVDFKGFDETEAPSTPSEFNWQPPVGWSAEPPRAASVDEPHRPKLFGWFTRRKSADSAMGGNLLPSRLPRVRSLKKMKQVHSAVAEEPKEEESTREEPSSSGVVVKIQCHELGDGWHERPMIDIIPRLRELKIK